VKMLMVVCGVVTPCVLVDGYQRIEGPYCLHLRGCVGSMGES
jgi:hypothetical protein